MRNLVPGLLLSLLQTAVNAETCAQIKSCVSCITAECGYSQGACVSSCAGIPGSSSCFHAENYYGLTSEEICAIAGASGTVEEAQEVPPAQDTETVPPAQGTTKPAVQTTVPPAQGTSPPAIQEFVPTEASSYCDGFEGQEDVDCMACFTDGCVIGPRGDCLRDCSLAPADASCWSMEHFPDSTRVKVCQMYALQTTALEEMNESSCPGFEDQHSGPADCEACLQAGCVVVLDICVNDCIFGPADAPCWNMEAFAGYTEAQVCTRKSITEQDVITCGMCSSVCRVIPFAPRFYNGSGLICYPLASCTTSGVTLHPRTLLNSLQPL
jgi:hypothetical protein